MKRTALTIIAVILLAVAVAWIVGAKKAAPQQPYTRAQFA